MPVLAYFATRTCPYCYSIGLWKVLLPLLALWVFFTPFFHLVDAIPNKKFASTVYVVNWALIGVGLGLVNVYLYQFDLSSTSGSIRVAVVGGVLLALFRNSFLLRRQFENIIAGQAEPVGEPNTSKSLIESTVHSIIIVYSMFIFLIVCALDSYLNTSGVYPQAMRLRAASSFIVDLVVIFVFHTFFSVLISLDSRRILSIGMNANLDALKEIMDGRFERRVPFFGQNEIGELGQAVNKVGTELSDKERIRSVFGKYLNPVIASKILKKSDGKLEGETKSSALFFMDIQGFTSLSEKNSPAQTVEILNHHFNCVVEILHKHNAIIDKFIGDAVLAYFDFESCETPASSALAAAQEILTKSPSLLPFGIGLHFGVIVAGNIGSSERLEYTIIGDSVNTVTRIEGLTRGRQVRALLSDEFVRELRKEGAQPNLRKQELVQVKGRVEPIQLWILEDEIELLQTKAI